MRRVIVLGLVVLMLALAGCADGGLDDGTDTPLDTDTPTPTDVEDTETETSTETPSTPTATDTQTETPDESPADTHGDLEIHHIDGGQADATLLITPDGETILIDSGDFRESGATVIEYLDAHDIDRIDHLIATHAHADHIGGHAAIIEHFEEDKDGIGAAYDSGVPHDTATYENYLDAIDEYDVQLLIVEEGDELPLDDETVRAPILNPLSEDERPDNMAYDLHYNSVTILFEFGDVRYLTTGDAEVDAEERMVADAGDALQADIYHAGHHGSSTSSTEAFMTEVQPETAIISSDFDSRFGHPHDEVLERFDDHGIETYWTGIHGDIVVTTDGTDTAFETTEEFSTDPSDIQDEKPTDEDASVGVVIPTIDALGVAISGA